MSLSTVSIIRPFLGRVLVTYFFLLHGPCFPISLYASCLCAEHWTLESHAALTLEVRRSPSPRACCLPLFSVTVAGRFCAEHQLEGQPSTSSGLSGAAPGHSESLSNFACRCSHLLNVLVFLLSKRGEVKR